MRLLHAASALCLIFLRHPAVAQHLTAAVASEINEFRFTRPTRNRRLTIPSAPPGNLRVPPVFFVQVMLQADEIMALDPNAEAARALHRFGFGPRGNTIADR
jgi:hypothetical protein